MARTILFDFRASTRHAQRGFRRMGRGLANIRRGYAQTKAAARDLRQRNRTLLGSFRRMGGGIGRVGLGVAQFAMGPLGILTSALRGVFGLVRSVISGFAKLATVTAAAATAVGVKAVAAFGGYERQMVRVRAITGATGEEWRRIEATIREVILTSEFMPEAIVAASKKLATMGVASADAFEKMLPAARRFATALEIDILEAADLLKKTMNAFGLPLEKATDTVEVFANAWANSAADAETLRDALKFTFNLSTNNQDLRDVVALIEALRDRGLEASQAGTALRNIFLTLQAPTPAAKKVLDEMGVSLDEVNMSTKSVIEILARLVEANMTTEQAARLFNMRASGAAAVLVKVFESAEGAAKSIRQYRRELDETGRVQRIISWLNDTLAQKWDIFKGSVSGFFINLGDKISHAAGFKGGLDGLTKSINSLSQSLHGLSDEAFQGLFKGLWEDLKSGAAFTALGDIFMAGVTALKPVLEWMGKTLGVALLRGLFRTVSETMERVSPWAKIFEKAFGVDFGDVVGAGLPDYPTLETGEFGEARRRAMERLRRGLGRFESTGDAAERMREELRRARAAGQHTLGIIGTGLPVGPRASVLQDNRRQIFYGAPSERFERQSRSHRINPSTGGNR